MKIAFLGNFQVPYSSESQYLKTLRKMGHQVYPLQEGTDNIHQIMSRTRDRDLFLWVHTHGWQTEGIEDGLEEMRELGIPSVGYHLDLWLGLKREKDLATDPYWNIDYFFSVDRLMVEYLNQHDTLPKGFFLPAGVYEAECYPTEPVQQYQHDIIFVGSGVYHPEWEYRQDLINWLHIKYGKQFAHYGYGGIKKIRGHELNQLYSSSKIVIGDTLCKNFDYPYYLSDRIFETTGRNGFIIHPHIGGIEDLYETQRTKPEGAEIITYPFNNFDYLEYLIQYFLDNTAERESIRARGHERTLREHTYTHRLSYLLETIKNERASK